MLIAIMCLFIIAAVLGSILLAAVLKNKSTPKVIVLLHGSFAFIALMLMIAYVVAGHTSPFLLASLTLLVLAEIGGLTLLTFDMRKKPIPKVLALLHPFVALSGLTILIVYIFMYVLQ